jgi:DNA modification methylase
VIKIFVGDCRAVLRSMPAESVHACVTSPPYYGLREYGIEPSIWGGDEACAHEWADDVVDRARATPGTGASGLTGGGKTQATANRFEKRSSFCAKCGAWKGVLGMEPDWRMYVEHMVEVFREVRRVLRADGTLWLNLGDSYATGAGAVGERPGGGAQGDAWAGRPKPGATAWAGRNVPHQHRGSREGAAGKHEYVAGLGPMTQPNRMPQHGMKAKDLMMMPARVAIALCDDGWYLRQDNVWAKPNPMPESVTDRFTKSHEYVFLLAKQERYFFDQEAILEPLSESTHLRVSQSTLNEQLGSDKVPGKTNGPMTVSLRGFKAGKPGSGIKNNESMNAAMVAPGRRSGNKARKPAGQRGPPGADPNDAGDGVAGSIPWEGFQRNKRSVWTVTTVPFGGEFCRACQTYFEGDALGDLRVEKIEKEGGGQERRRWCRCGVHDKWLSHFATFPPTLIEPCIKAGASEKGCCAKCGAPWVRESETKYDTQGRTTNGQRSVDRRHEKPGFEVRAVKHVETIGWSPTCECAVQTADGKLNRCVVLDPFGGAGTTGMAADRLHRDAVLIESNPEYAEMARQRLQLDAGPMFGDVRLVAAPIPEAAE